MHCEKQNNNESNQREMLVTARKLSVSTLKPIFSLSFLFSQRLTTAETRKDPSLSHFSSFLTHNRHIPIRKSSLFFISSFSSCSSSSNTLPLIRDGNYDDATPSSVVCPGCGVHVQDSDPKLPGFFIKPSQQKKDPIHKSTAHLVSVSQEPEFNDSLKRGLILESENAIADAELKEYAPVKPVVCARCHSLRHYGKVKDPTVENLLPDFDFDHTVGMRLGSASGTRTVVLMVVDAVDFDGSFPRKVAKVVSASIEENSTAWKEGKSGNVPRVVLVVTKIDLLPTSLSPTRFEHWVRQRAREAGLVRIAKLHFVSAVRNWGLKDLVEDVVALAGKRGNVWAVGAQNAGKSTLINALGKTVGGNLSHLTEAPVPGTTLGIVRVEGVLPGQAKLFDTPGLLHPHQITTRLTREEQKLVHVCKELKPRTYRVKEGHSIHIGGLMRLDISEASVDTVYVTVWASPYLPLHMGKTENADTMLEDHFGRQLQPPIGENRVKELGKWVRKQFHITGNSWDSSCVDVASAGLGWFAIGLKGEAMVNVWSYEGVDVILRNSLLPHRSQVFEVAGFTISKIVSKADQAVNKSQWPSEKKRKQSNTKASGAC